MFRSLLRPGQGFKTFTVLRSESEKTPKGRIITGDRIPVGSITGIITKTDPEDKDQHKQEGHPIRYTIVQQGAKDQAKANDVLELVEDDITRHFLVKKKPRDPAGLGHFTIYHVEERDDLKWE